MKKIRFKEIALMSYSGAARRINLDNNLVIVAGGNESGKSSILKTLYYTLGATVYPFARRWERANVASLLKFTIDGVNFKAVRVASDVYVFNPDNTLRFHDWNKQKIAEEMNNLLGIPPFFKDKDGNSLTLSTGCLFMPFYIDQDKGWDQPWNSLLGLNGGKHNAMLFHTGAIDEEYYSYKCLLDQSESRLKDVVNEISGSLKFKSTFMAKYKEAERLPFNDEDFNRGIQDVLEKLKELKEEQKQILQELEKLYAAKYSYQFNVDQLKENIAEINKDFNYALKSPTELCCPMCGAMVENGQYERFRMLDDRDRCKSLLIENNKRLEEITEKINTKEILSDRIKQKIASIQASFSNKSDKVSLEDMFIEKMKEHVETVMTRATNDLLDEKIKLEREIKYLKDNLKRVNKEEIKKQIEKDFDAYLKKTLREFGLDKSEYQKRFKLGSRINTTGSNVVKHIVAYTYAYYYVMQKYNCPFFSPIVIDEPKQKGLDDNGFSSTIDFIINGRPSDSQLILSLTDSELNLLPEKYNPIMLRSGNDVMNSEEYESVRNEIDELIYTEGFSLTSPR